MASPFDHPEAQELFGTLLRSLGKESDRGMVLIGAARIDNCLTTLFQAVFPPSLGKKARKQLLEYPGPLSSFSAKTEVAFALRLIPRMVYDALHAVRRLRNELAHSPDEFDLREHEQRYRAIFELGPNLANGVRRLSYEMMLDSKAEATAAAVRKLNEEDPDGEPYPWTVHNFVQFIQEHPDVQQGLERQIPHWELAMGFALLGSLIILHRDRAREVLGAADLLGDLGKSGRSKPTGDSATV